MDIVNAQSDGYVIDGLLLAESARKLDRLLNGSFHLNVFDFKCAGCDERGKLRGERYYLNSGEKLPLAVVFLEHNSVHGVENDQLFRAVGSYCLIDSDGKLLYFTGKSHKIGKVCAGGELVFKHGEAYARLLQ